MTGPGAPIHLPVGGREEAGVTAGVSTLSLLQATVALLSFLHHRVTTETGAPVVLLQQQPSISASVSVSPSTHLLSRYEALLFRNLQDGLNLISDFLQAAGGELEIILTCPTGGHQVLRGLPTYLLSSVTSHHISFLPGICSQLYLHHDKLQMNGQPHERAS